MKFKFFFKNRVNALKVRYFLQMDVLTYENVSKLINNFNNNNNLIWDQTSIAYILNLVIPYGLASEPATDIESIVEWIPTTFLDNLANELLWALNDEKLDLDGAKITVIETLIKLIYDTIIRKLENNNLKTILPWDIQYILANDPEFADAFGLGSEYNTLPVGMVFGPDVFVHNVTEEFITGLVIFSSASDFNFPIYMYGKELNPDVFINTDRYIYTGNITTNFTINIKNTIYEFDSCQFLKGFVTCSSWAGLNHIYYWTKFMYYEETESGTITQQEVTF